VLRVLFFALIFPVLEQCANLVAERGLISQSRSSRKYQSPGMNNMAIIAPSVAARS
jgi:hypothetical protein